MGAFNINLISITYCTFLLFNIKNVKRHYTLNTRNPIVIWERLVTILKIRIQQWLFRRILRCKRTMIFGTFRGYKLLHIIIVDQSLWCFNTFQSIHIKDVTEDTSNTIIEWLHGCWAVMILPACFVLFQNVNSFFNDSSQTF